MFALSFRFPAGRYHATPWGRNVNEAEIAWPPEPWRLLRALIAAYWRKGDRERWSRESLAQLVDALAGGLPVYRLPEGAIHAHTRHYMPVGTIEKGREKTTLVFDAFLRLPEKESITAAWPEITLDTESFALAAELASAISYLGRAESWTECEALAAWDGDVNCRPLGTERSADPVRLLAPLSPAMYAAERRRLIADEEERIRVAAKKPLSPKWLENEVLKSFRSRGRGMDTLPERLVDALNLDTTDFQDRGWKRPPAAREVVYARDREAAGGVVSRAAGRRQRSGSKPKLPTVARFLLAGRPRPRVEDSVKLGELMRLAALSKFGWRYDDESGRRLPKAPWQISGRGADGKPLRDPSHGHAFWLPEDADSDGLIDHISVFVAGGIDHNIRTKLDRITRLWLEPKQQAEDSDTEFASAGEWRLALEGFGEPGDFASSAQIFGRTSRWSSATPFLAAGYLKAGGYAAEFRRLVNRIGLDRRFGFDAAEIKIRELQAVPLGGISRRVLHFHRFRSRGREAQHDTAGIFLDVVFPAPINGPLALGFGCHFGLGLFVRG